MKISFIGAGNMGGAAALGFAKCGHISPSDITVTARHAASLERFAPHGINTTTDNVAAVREADIVFYAVKPWQMEEVLRQTAPALDYSRQLIVSIAPGVTPVQLKEWLAKDSVPAIAYVIPNTAIEIGESMTFVAPVTASAVQAETLKDLFDLVGQTRIVPLEQMLAGTSLASCGIAYAMRYIEASTAGGDELGLEDSQGIVCQTVRGAADLIMANESTAHHEIDKVTTPNGLTLKGLNAMESAGFTESVIKGVTVLKTPRRRVVVKVGSNVLTRQDGSLDTTRVSSIVDQIVTLRKAGYDVVLVTSGAVACGRSLLKPSLKLTDVQQRQLYSAVGQVRLMDLYYKLFIDYGINVGQVLTMKKNFSSEIEYNNQRGCIEVMIQDNVIPIVNENDTVSITELMFTDNDELSGLVAEMVGAESLIILTNVDGVFDGALDEPESKVIARIAPGESIEGYISESRSSAGRGGMKSKCHVACEAASKGIRVIIANGRREGILVDVLTDPESVVHTEFTPTA